MQVIADSIKDWKDEILAGDAVQMLPGSGRFPC
jgi:hypothetical protein